MKRLLITLSLIFLLGSSSQGFHADGVASCNSCHVMHNSQDGEPVDFTNPLGNEILLKDESPSDVCLSCHADQNGSVLGSDPLNPPPERGPGNFVFLFEDNINDAIGGATSPIPGDASGHNFNAPSVGIAADGTNLTAPGGTYPSLNMSCTSCHDPHGNQNYRQLYGAGDIQGGTFQFIYPAPIAEGIDFNSTESQTNHNAYTSGMNEWCMNCHTSVHTQGAGAGFRHDMNELLPSSVISYYNVYNGTADMTGGTYSTAYLAEVPFEDATVTTTSTTGATSNSRLMCLSCHRAHGSSSPSAGRWDFNVTFLVDDGVASGSYPIPNPYGTNNQRPLCQKCHMQGSGGGGGGATSIPIE